MTDSASTGAPERHDSGPSQRLVSVAVVIAALLVLAAGTAVALDQRRTDPTVEPVSTPTTVDLDSEQRAIGADFLAAWNRWRTTDLVATGQFARERPDGERLESDTMVAQLDDMRLVSRLGGTTGYVGDERVRCVTESNGSFRCDRTPTGQSAALRLTGELDQWASYLSGSPPYYRIIRSDSGPDLECYELVLTVTNPAADFGSVAQFCFELQTGLLRRTVIDYANGLVETTDLAVTQLGEIDAAIFDTMQIEPTGG